MQRSDIMRRGLALATLCFATANCSTQAPKQESLASASQQALESGSPEPGTAAQSAPEYRSLLVPVPSAASSGPYGIVGLTGTTVYSQARVNTPILTSGSGLTSVEPDARVKAISAYGNVVVRSRSLVDGDLRTTESATIENGATVTGAVAQQANLGALELRQWASEVPSGECNDFFVNPGGQSSLSPGCYQTLQVGPGGVLELSAGVYRVRTMRMEPGSRLVVHNQDERALLVIDEEFYTQPQIAVDVPAQFGLLYYGTAPLLYRGSALGLIYAPHAVLQLEPWQQHRGQFVARTINVGPGATVNYVAPSFDSLFPALPNPEEGVPEDHTRFSVALEDATLDSLTPNATLGQQPRLRASAPEQRHIAIGPDVAALRQTLQGRRIYSASLVLKLDGEGKGHASGISALPLDVAWSEASSSWSSPGTGAWDLTLPFDEESPLAGTSNPAFGRPSSGGDVASITLDVTRDLAFLLASDAEFDGWLVSAAAGDFTFGSSENPAAELRPELVVLASEETCAGCGGLLWPPPGSGQTILEDPISAAETTALVSGFEWENTTAVAELNADGDPALWYALIYVEDKLQLETLSEYGIEWDPLPYFPEELQRWQGQSGVFAFEGNIDGVFVFAMIPGAAYNAIRAANLEDADGADFRAIILRDVPQAYAASDGSISYQALADEGFVYAAGPSGSIEEDQDLRRFLRRFREAIRQGIRAVVDGVRRGLAEISGAVRGESRLSLTMGVADYDTAFRGRNMVRAWGEEAGEEIRLENLPILVRQGRVGIGLRKATTDSQGRAGVDVTHGRDLSLCVDLKTPAATITRWVLPERICSFDIGVTLDRVQRDTHVNVSLYHPDIYAMAQFQDSREYARDVLGMDMPAAHVISGRLGDAFTFDDRAFTPCLNHVMNAFGTLSSAIVSLLAVFSSLEGVADGRSDLVTFLVGLGATVDGLLHGAHYPDIVLARVSGENRTTATHEYGHFLQCVAMIQAENTPGPDSPEFERMWASVSRAALFDGGSDIPARFMSEAIADWFSSQVAGGVEYLGSAFYAPSFPDADSRFCETDDIDSPSSCLETNHFPAGSQLSSIATWAGIFHDVFDGHIHPSLDPLDQYGTDANRPGTGMAWIFEDGGPAEYAPYHVTSDDEVIAALGTVFVDIWRDYFALTDRYESHEERWNSGRMEQALFNGLRRLGYTPTEICQLFAIHSADGGMSTDGSGCLGMQVFEVRVPLEVRDATPPATLNPVDWLNNPLIPPGQSPIVPYVTLTADGDVFEEGVCSYIDQRECTLIVPEGGRVSFTVDEEYSYGGYRYLDWIGSCSTRPSCDAIIVEPTELRLLYTWNHEESDWVPEP